MPEPRDDEAEDDFVKRCIPVVLHEDGDVEHIDHAVAKCHGIWRQYHKNGGILHGDKG